MNPNPEDLQVLPSGRWQDLATTDFARVDPARTIALLPVAAIEQHGPHLPLATDALINQGVVAEALRRLPATASVLVLPALDIGDSLEHSAFPGTLSADLDALLGLWLAVGRGVAHAGVKKLVIFNSHGGQRAHVDLAALRLRVAHGLLVVRAHSFSFGVPPGLFDAEELAHGLHGGAVETSLILHLRPELVRREALADFPSFGARLAARGGLLGAERPVGIAWMAQDLNPRGACGNAAAASAEKGRALLDHLAARLVWLLAEVEALPVPGG
ncbi:MAG: creatininase family protein [Burkholderiaceae bacterium]|nr:creatininase family protein [Burkholderiaceae bacterium]